MSQASNCVIWFDEYHNEINFEGLLQACYDNDGYHRSSDNTTSKTNSVDIYSSLLLTSNYTPENSIFFSRCLYVPVPVPQKTEQQRRKFEELERYIKTGISSITADLLQYRSLIELNFADYYDQINLVLKYIAKERQESIDERFFTNMASVLTCITILACHDKIQICEYTSQDKGHLIDYTCGIGYKFMSKHFNLMNEASPLYKFFEQLNLMYERYIIHEEVHFKFGKDEQAGKIAFRFGKIYSLFAEQYRKTNYESPPSKEDIKQELMVFFEMKEWKEGRAKMMNSLNEETKESTNVIWLDYEKLKNHFELDLHKRRDIKNA